MDENKEPLDRGPFFHGTKAQLAIGDLLEAQNQSNYQDKKSNYIYFTATLEAAKWELNWQLPMLQRESILSNRSANSRTTRT